MENVSSYSIKELREKAQRTAPEAGRDPWIGYSIRFFSIYITKLLIRFPITANQVTVVSVLVFFAGMSLFFFQSFSLYLLGVFLVYFSVVLDGCDGEVARLKGNKRGVGGIYTEPVSHDIQYAYMIIPPAVGVFLATGSVTIVFVAFIGTIAKLLYRFFMIRFDQLLLYRKMQENSSVKFGDKFVQFDPNVSGIHKAYRFINRNFLSSVGNCIPLLICTLFGHIDLFVWIFAVFFVLSAAMKFFLELRYIIALRD